ncbi:MAG TPA: YceI family protein [Flavisolibacter sp.]|jgi:polyisoprenoid-binding protein YceI|nr:YceI family protein [Flavisolibacter sp.]
MKQNFINKSFRLLLIAATALLVTTQLNAQNIKKSFSYDITLLGNSNIHKWTMKSSGSNLEANLNLDPSTKQLEGIQPLTFNMPVKSLKSDESLLNSRAYDALKADKFPHIVFKLLSATPSGSQMTMRGQLTISGNTRDITLVANSQKTADGNYILSGTKNIKFSEFGLSAPKYMMGVMKVYDDLTINYNVRF